MTPIEALLEGTGLSADVIARLARYGRLVLDVNSRVNVTAARSTEEIAAQIADSLSVLRFVQPPYVDVGSGAGLPPIPVAIASGVEPTMIEATAKKARLLESMLLELNLRGTVVAARAEVAGHRPDLREHFASGTCRAVGSATAVAELLLPLIALDGVAILQRGAMGAGERAALEDASLVLGGRLEAEHEIGGNRRLLVIRKCGSTSARFPRRTGIPVKRPLCA